MLMLITDARTHAESDQSLKMWFSDSRDLKICKTIKISISKIWPKKQFFLYLLWLRESRNNSFMHSRKVTLAHDFNWKIYATYIQFLFIIFAHVTIISSNISCSTAGCPHHSIIIFLFFICHIKHSCNILQQTNVFISIMYHYRL